MDNNFVEKLDIFPYVQLQYVTFVNKLIIMQFKFSEGSVAVCSRSSLEHSRQWQTALQDVRGYRGPDVASYHYLLVAKLKLKLRQKEQKRKPSCSMWINSSNQKSRQHLI